MGREDLLRNPRVIVAPSQRIPNWRSLPVEGTGERPVSLCDRACQLGVVAFGLVVAYLCASRGWSW